MIENIYNRYISTMENQPSWKDLPKSRQEAFARMVIMTKEEMRQPPTKEKIIVYDIEIKYSPDKVGGWKAYDRFGISCIGTYDYSTDQYRVFDHTELELCWEFMQSAKCIVGYNNHGFDDPTIAAHGMDLSKTQSWDILAALRAQAKSQGHTASGFKLDNTANLTFGTKKSGSGAHALDLWEQNKLGELHSYCNMDVRLTKKILDRILIGEPILSGNPPSSFCVKFDWGLIQEPEQQTLFSTI